MIDKLKKNKGSVLAFVLIIVFVVSLIVFSLAALTSQNLNNVSGKYWEERARFGALAGVQRALTELDNDETWSAGFNQEPLEGDPEVTYSVQVLNRLDLPGQFAPDGKTWVPEDSVWIHSVASLAFRRSAGVSSLVSIVGPQRPVFNNAVFAVRTITLDNSQTLAWHPAGNGDGQAWLGTSSTDPDAVQILNSSFVDGDVVSGVDPNGVYNPVTIDGTSSIFGTEKTSEETILVTGFVSPILEMRNPPDGPGTYDTISIPPPTPGAVGQPPGAVYHLPGAFEAGWTRVSLQPDEKYRTIDLNAGQELFLEGGGNYLFQGTLDIRDGARIVVNPATVSAADPAVIYLDDDLIVMDGAQINWDNTTNQPGEPRALQIYDTERTDDLLPGPPAPATDGVVDNRATSVIQTTDHVSMIYGGKNLQLYMYDASLYGAIIADQVELKNSTLYYDTRNRGVKMNGRGEITVMSSTIESAGEASEAVASDTTTNPAAPLPPPPPVATTAPPPPPAPGGPDPPAPPPPTTPPTYPHSPEEGPPGGGPYTPPVSPPPSVP